MKKPSTTLVALRLDSDLLAKLDEMADVEGLTRTAVIERLCRREFTSVRMVGPASLLKRAVVDTLTPLEGDPVVEWLLCGPPGFSGRDVKGVHRAKK